jgi:hypothetical protein
MRTVSTSTDPDAIVRYPAHRCAKPSPSGLSTLIEPGHPDRKPCMLQRTGLTLDSLVSLGGKAS